MVVVQQQQQREWQQPTAAVAAGSGGVGKGRRSNQHEWQRPRPSVSSSDRQAGQWPTAVHVGERQAGSTAGRVELVIRATAVVWAAQVQDGGTLQESACNLPSSAPYLQGPTMHTPRGCVSNRSPTSALFVHCTACTAGTPPTLPPLTASSKR